MAGSILCRFHKRGATTSAIARLPATTSSQIIELHGNEARFSSHPLQIISTRQQKFSYLNIGYKILKARHASSDLTNETIDFCDFEFCSNTIGRRKFIRVAPDSLIKVQVTSPKLNSGDQTEEKWFNAWLVDLSIHGAAIFVHPIIMKQMDVYDGDPLQIKFNLAMPQVTGLFKIELKATIRNLNSIDEKYIRTGLETTLDPTIENYLTGYVAQLQKTIIHELREKLDQAKLEISANCCTLKLIIVMKRSKFTKAQILYAF